MIIIYMYKDRWNIFSHNICNLETRHLPQPTQVVLASFNFLSDHHVWLHGLRWVLDFHDLLRCSEMPSGGKRLRPYGGGNGVSGVAQYVLKWVWLADKAFYCTKSSWRQFVRDKELIKLIEMGLGVVKLIIEQRTCGCNDWTSSWCTPPKFLTLRPWNMTVGRWLSFLDGLLGANC